MPPPLPEDIREEVQANYREYEAQIAQLKTERDDLLKERNALQKNIGQLRRELNKLQQILIDSQARRKELEKLIEKIPFQRPVTPTRVITPLITPFEKITSTPAAPPERIINGKISGINLKINLVILSLGLKDEIKIGLTGNVYRDDKIIGEIAMDLVEQDWSSGHIVREDSSLRIGDQVVFKIK